MSELYDAVFNAFKSDLEKNAGELFPFIQPTFIQVNQLSMLAAAVSDRFSEQLKKRNLDLAGDVGKLSAINVIALNMLKRLVEKSREPSEGDCVYCNCELGGGNDDDCYDDCIIVEVRKLLVTADQRC